MLDEWVPVVLPIDRLVPEPVLPFDEPAPDDDMPPVVAPVALLPLPLLPPGPPPLTPEPPLVPAPAPLLPCAIVMDEPTARPALRTAAMKRFICLP